MEDVCATAKELANANGEEAEFCMDGEHALKGLVACDGEGECSACGKGFDLRGGRGW